MQIRASVNRKLPGIKLDIGDPRWADFNGSFQLETHTSESLLEEIRQGHSICAELGNCEREHCDRWCCPGRRKRSDSSHCGRPAGYRISWHFVASQALALDFDEGNLDLDELMDDSFINSYATFIYSTISHA